MRNAVPSAVTVPKTFARTAVNVPDVSTNSVPIAAYVSTVPTQCVRIVITVETVRKKYVPIAEITAQTVYNFVQSVTDVTDAVQPALIVRCVPSAVLKTPRVMDAHTEFVPRAVSGANTTAPMDSTAWELQQK